MVYHVYFTDANNGSCSWMMMEQFSRQQTEEQPGYHKQAELLNDLFLFISAMQITVGGWRHIGIILKNNKWRHKLDITNKWNNECFIWCYLSADQIRYGCGKLEQFSKPQMEEQTGCYKQAELLNLYGVSFTDANTGTAVGVMEQYSEQQMEEQPGHHKQAEQQLFV